jgi:hypothetical protein
LDRVTPLARSPFAGHDLQVHFLFQGAAEEAANTVGLPLRSGNKLLQCGTAGSLQQFQNPARLATPARWSGVLDAARPFTPCGLLRHQTEPHCARVRGQALGSRPNPGDSDLPTGELLDGFARVRRWHPRTATSEDVTSTAQIAICTASRTSRTANRLRPSTPAAPVRITCHGSARITCRSDTIPNSKALPNASTSATT